MKPTIGQRLTAKLINFDRKQAGFEKKIAKLDGLEMVYYENQTLRDKPTLVLVHGYTADKTMWHNTAKMLGKDFHIIAPDMAGHGETKYDKTANYSMPTQAAWIEKLLTHLGIKQVHFAGSSMGGFISATFAKLYPKKTLSLILIDPAGIAPPEPSDIQIVYETEGRNMFLPETVAEYTSFMDLVMAKPPFTPKFIFRAMAKNHISRRDSYAHIFEDFFDKDRLEESLKDIKVPTLMIWGRQDQIIHVSAAPIWQAGIKNCKTIIWDDLGHVPTFEAPKRTAAAMKTFWDGVTA